MLTQELTPVIAPDFSPEEISTEIDPETQRYLLDLLAQENILAQEKKTAGELICGLIRDRWMSLYAGCAPEFSSGFSSEFDAPQVAPVMTAIAAAPPRRKNSKQMISDFMRRKCHSPNLCI